MINTTSAGDDRQRKTGLTLELAPLPVTAAVCDVVYNPLETELLKDAARRGHKVIDGLGMLDAPGDAILLKHFSVCSPKSVTPGLRTALVTALHGE